MKLLRAGNSRVPDSVGHVTYNASRYSDYAMAVPSWAMTYKPTCQHWLLTDGFVAVLGAPYFANCLAPMDGVIYKARWVDLEPTTAGGYDWSKLDAAVDYCAARGKRLLLRLWFKSYTDAVDPPANPPIPAYIVANPGTYGGATGSGGLRRAYTLPTWAGWGARLEHPAVQDRFGALLDAIGARYRSASAWLGYGLDESTWGIESPMPGDLTSQQVVDANKALHRRMALASGDKRVLQFVNYLDGGTDLAVLEEYMAWGKQLGLGVGITDVFALPQRVSALQPSYFFLPDAERFTIICSEGLTYGADDAGLSGRIDDAFRGGAYLGPDIHGWSNKGGPAANSWLNVLRVLGRA